MTTPDDNLKQLSRRTFLRGSTAAAATLATASLPLPALARAGGAEAPDNVRVSDDGYGVHAEPSVASNPRDPRNLLGASMVGPAEWPELIATYASFDGGRTWHSNGALPLPPATAWADDVTVGFDGQGAGFVCAMASGQGYNDRGVYFWRTDDGGRSFAPPVAAITGQFADHPWLAVDRSRYEEPGNVYAVWVAADRAALGFGRSTDGGRTFEPPRMIQGPADHNVMSPMLAAGAGGRVCAVYGGPPPARGNGPDYYLTVEAVCSTDYGETFGEPIALGVEAMEIFPPGGAHLESTPAVAIAPDGASIYAAFATHEPGAAHSDIVLSASSDGGRTWRPATQVTPSDQAIYFQPQLAVDESGRVAVSALALEQGRVDVVLFVSEAHAPRFGRRLVVTSQSFDPSLGVTGTKYDPWWIGDYQGLTSTPDAFHPFWNDTRTGRLELFTATVRGR